MESQLYQTDINYIGVLEYLISNQEIPYSSPDAVGLNPDEKNRLLEVKRKGQEIVHELKKMADVCAQAFNLDKCMTISWLDGSNTKTCKYLWVQMKYKNYADNPTSISIFIEKNSDSTAHYRISLELKNDGADKETVARYHSYLDEHIDFSTGLVLVSGSNKWGRPDIINETQESAKAKIAEGKLRKVQLCKNIERKPDETNAYYHEELIKAVRLLIPYYNHVLGITSADESWFPSKEEYDPGISAEQWVQLLQNKELTTENNLLMFAMMLNYNKPASCSELAVHYGKTSNYFNSGSSSYAEKVAKRIGCPLPPAEINENARWWPILYVGRDATKDEMGSYIWKIRDELKEALEQIELPKIEEKKKMAGNIEYGLNTILYGPPGTGKTYNTAHIAVSICEPELNVSEMTYKDVIKKYNQLKNAGRIEFVTFHQSYSYEEFIEGIKPIMDDDDSEKNKLEYKIKPGVFKSFCEKAGMPKKKSNEDYGLNASPTVWKVSLEGTGENLTRRECFDNDHIRIGWDEYGPEITEQTVETENYTGGIVPLNAFINNMKIGDIVLSCYKSTQIDAIGIITGDYEWSGLYDYYNRLRKVKWLVKDIREDIVELNGGKTLTLSTVYKLSISPKDVLEIVKKYADAEGEGFEPNTDNYVFIIDEINRGNISKIFGELITLIEKTKRAGAVEPMEVKLPYSGELFSVPKNVYILGTMNTADRSIALMDTALRRRFDFIEKMPDSSVIKGLTISDAGETLDVVKMLEEINKRIEYLYDREHTIGHAFFKELETDENNNMKCLADIFRKKVIPLLQEYFYEDYEKIQLILGDNEKSSPDYKFVLDEKNEESTLFKGTPDLDVKEKKYSIQKEAFDKIQSYIEITEKR